MYHGVFYDTPGQVGIPWCKWEYFSAAFRRTLNLPMPGRHSSRCARTLNQKMFGNFKKCLCFKKIIQQFIFFLKIMFAASKKIHYQFFVQVSANVQEFQKLFMSKNVQVFYFLKLENVSELFKKLSDFQTLLVVNTNSQFPRNVWRKIKNCPDSRCA